MPIYFVKNSLARRGLVVVASSVLAITCISQTACTRDEVAAAISTIAVDLEATLQPWGATAVANAQSVATQVPSLIATSKAFSPSDQPTGEVNQQMALNPVAQSTELPVDESGSPKENEPLAATATLIPTSSPTPLPTATLLPSSTPTPTHTASPTATPTQTFTPTPYPQEIEVMGGKMVRIPGGVFYMGASTDSLVDECAAFREGCQRAWFAASEPVHTVLLRSYYIDLHEVTNEAYAEFLNLNGNTCLDQACIDPEQSPLTDQAGAFVIEEGLSQHPATGVTWYGAHSFCAWRGARLPTDAEWEKAAAWDSEATASRRYPWGDVFDGRYLNSCDASCDESQANSAFNDGQPTTAPVASYSDGRSAFGLYDMAGNLWEWVADWYDPSYYLVSAEANPPGPESGTEKVVRGGSWFDTGNFTATTIRFPSAPTNADKTIGFRCAADLPK